MVKLSILYYFVVLRTKINHETCKFVDQFQLIRTLNIFSEIYYA